MWNTREEHGGVGAQNGCKQGKWHLTSCNLWTSFQRQETHRSDTGRAARVRHKEAGIRGAIHRMLAHQSYTDTKKGKRESCDFKVEAWWATQRETKRETGSVCVCVCVCVMRERMMVSKASSEWGAEVKGGLRRPLDTDEHSSSQRTQNHKLIHKFMHAYTHTRTHTRAHTLPVWGRHTIKQNKVKVELTHLRPIWKQISVTIYVFTLFRE